MNMWGFTPRLFPQLEADFITFLRAKGAELKSESYIPMAVGALVKSRQASCRVLRSDAAWFGVTYREDRAVVVESIRVLIRAGAYPERLWS